MNESPEPLQRLYNGYASSAGNAHAEAIDEIMTRACKEVTDYLAAHNVCPRDAMGCCIMNVTAHMSEYTLRRAMRIRRAERALQYWRGENKPC